MTAHNEMSEIHNSRFWPGGSSVAARPVTWSTAAPTDGEAGHMVGALWIRCIAAGNSLPYINRGSATSATWKAVTLTNDA